MEEKSPKNTMNGNSNSNSNSHQYKDNRGYIKVNSVNLENDQIVEEYFSLHSGLRIILSNKIKSPKIYGFFTVITEVENSEGLPHTLEHLIFLGSRKYPYKGLLDFLSYKCLSEGTNAWTATDHTCYTIETIGVEGFCSILPVYLDFILNPILEDDFFISEVHHIYEHGEHNGVVYSEMKSVENNCNTIISRTVLTSLFPNEKSSYRFETGGTLEGLRATTNDRVKEYFKRFYKLDNLVAIIFGNFESELILDVIRKFEEYHLHLHPEQRRKEQISDMKLGNVEEGIKEFAKHLKNPNRPWRKPENLEKRKDSKIIKKYYPSNTLDNGQVTVAWRGCEWNQFKTKLAIDLMGSYLTDFTTSPLGKKLLEGENNYCAAVEYDQEDFCDSSYMIDIYDVPYKGDEWKQKVKKLCQKKKKETETVEGGIDKNEETKKNENEHNAMDMKNGNKKNIVTFMDVVGEISRECLQEVYDAPLDMGRMKGVVNRCYLQHLKSMEHCLQSTLIDYLVKYAIYGTQSTDFENNIDHKKFYKELLEEEEKYWKGILKKYFIDNDYVEVKCYPSLKKAKQLELFEKNLKEEEQKKYGKKKLNEMVEQVKKIVHTTKQLPPPEAFDVISFADPKKVVIPSVLLFRNFEDTYKSSTSEQKQKQKLQTLEEGPENEPKIKLLQKIGKQLSLINFPLQMNQVDSSMVFINIFINIDNISDDLKKFLPLLSFLLYESDIKVNNEIITSEVFMSELLKNTITYEDNVGLFGNAKNFKSGFLSNVFYINILGLISNYEHLFDLLFLAMFNMHIDKSRLKLIMKSSCQHMLKQKTEPKTLLYNLHYFLRYKENSNTSFVSLGKQEGILKMKESQYDYIISKLNELKKVLFDPNNFLVTIDANFEKLTDCFSWHARWFSKDDQGMYKILNPQIDIFQNEEVHKGDANFTIHMGEEGATTHQHPYHLKQNEEKLSEKKTLEEQTSEKTKETKEQVDVNAITNVSTDLCNNFVQKKLSDANKNVKKKSVGVYEALGERTHNALKTWLNTPYESEDKNFKTNIVKNRACNGIICGTPSADVSYLLITVKVSAGYEHEDYPELLVLSEYLSMTEGPLYRSVRGGGHAYGVSCRFDAFMGELTLQISAASDLISALKESYSVFESACETKLTEEQLTLAKYSTYYMIFDKQETVNDRLLQSVILGLLNIDLNYYSELLNKVSNVSVDSLHKATQKYLTKFLQFKVDESNAIEGSTMCIICAEGKMQKIKEALKEELKFEQTVSLQTSQLYRLLKTYDLESVVKEDAVEAEQQGQLGAKGVKENNEEAEAEAEEDEESVSDYEDDDEDTSGTSVNLSDDSYMGDSDE